MPTKQILEETLAIKRRELTDAKARRISATDKLNEANKTIEEQRRGHHSTNTGSSDDNNDKKRHSLQIQDTERKVKDCNDRQERTDDNLRKWMICSSLMVVIALGVYGYSKIMAALSPDYTMNSF